MYLLDRPFSSQSAKLVISGLDLVSKSGVAEY